MPKYQQETIALIKRIKGQGNVLIVPRLFIEFMGSLEGGLFLSQLLYWSGRTKNPERWVYKTYAEWQAEISLSEHKVRQNSRKMVEMGFLETKIGKANGNPTVHYRLIWPNFLDSFLQFLSNDPVKIAETITETTNIDSQTTMTKAETVGINGEADFAAIRRLYETEIGRLTPVVEDKLLAALECYPATWIERALILAAQSGDRQRNWRYIAGILANWAKNGGPEHDQKSIKVRSMHHDKFNSESKQRTTKKGLSDEQKRLLGLA